MTGPAKEWPRSLDGDCVKVIYLGVKGAMRRMEVANPVLTVLPLHSAERVNHVDGLDF